MRETYASTTLHQRTNGMRLTQGLCRLNGFVSQTSYAIMRNEVVGRGNRAYILCFYFYNYTTAILRYYFV